MKKEEIKKTRQKLVVKSNNLIRDTRYELSELEQKFIIYLISNIDKNDTELKELQIKLKDYCAIAGIEYTSGNIKHLRDTIQNLYDKSWWIVKEDGTWQIFSWLADARIKGQVATIELSKHLKPYVLELKENFTRYELINVLLLRGKYSVRLYELFKSYLYLGEWNVKVNDLRLLINCDKYERFAEFNRNILKKSIEEINKHTDIKVTYEPIRVGRFVEEIEFYIEEKRGVDATLEMLEHRNERLKGKLL